MREFWLLAAAAVLLALPRPATGQGVADPERGRALYENHCQVCHTPKIHRRPNRLPINWAQLREIVDGWQRAEYLRWDPADVADVVEYLNRTHYRYVP